MFAATIPERPGSFKEFCRLLGRSNITEFNYRFGDPAEAHVFVGLSVGTRREGQAAAVDRAGRDQDARPDGQRARQAARAPPRRRAGERAERDPLPLRVPRAAGRADALPRRDEPTTGTSASSTTATTAPTTAASSPASRCRRRSAARFASRCGGSATRTSRRPGIRRQRSSSAPEAFRFRDQATRERWVGRRSVSNPKTRREEPHVPALDHPDRPARPTPARRLRLLAPVTTSGPRSSTRGRDYSLSAPSRRATYGPARRRGGPR